MSIRFRNLDGHTCCSDGSPQRSLLLLFRGCYGRNKRVCSTCHPWMENELSWQPYQCHYSLRTYVAKQIWLKVSLHGARGAWWELVSGSKGQAVLIWHGSEWILTSGASEQRWSRMRLFASHPCLYRKHMGTCQSKRVGMLNLWPGGVILVSERQEIISAFGPELWAAMFVLFHRSHWLQRRLCICL